MEIRNTKTKFKLNDKVRIREGFYKGYKGQVKDYRVESKDGEIAYKVEFPELDDQWLNEKLLEKKTLFLLFLR